ncbi:MAG: hypothetical protein JXO22_12105 [Phycisphaerae bacterium]|nr:hypothetical protein [Phycisphaerae bacterium]
MGKLMRYILNINTIWGLMILVAFLLCVAQHYMPTKTLVPVEQLRSGSNLIAVTVKEPDDTRLLLMATLWLHEGSLDIDRLEVNQDDRTDWTISAERINDYCLLTWDCKATGEYVLEVGDQPVSKGRLVRLESLTNAAFDYAKSAFDIALGLVAVMVLFLGLMKVGEDAGIVQMVARLFYPIIRFLFPSVPKDHPAMGAIVMNWTTTILGLGNAATPFGIKAMEELQKLNKNTKVATDAQIMLLGYNTAGFALLPTTLLAVRSSAGCSDPLEIIAPCMVAGLTATITAIVLVKLLGALPMFSVAAAMSEDLKGDAASTENAVGDNQEGE